MPALDRLPARKRYTRTYSGAGAASWFLKLAPVKASVITAVLLVLLGGCSSSSAPSPQTHPRIVSLIPSLTEDLCAIGAAKQLAGVSQFSNGIPCAKGLPQVDDASSVDAEKIVRLHPGLVVGIPSQARAVAALKRTGINVVLLPDDSYADLFADIARLGSLSGHIPEAQKLTASLRAQTKKLQSAEHFSRRPSVFVVLQTTPVWTVGPNSYISTLIKLAGGRNAVVSLPQDYAQYSGEALVRLQPDALLATRDTQLEQNLAREPWRALKAVAQRHVMIAPNADVLYRPGPRYNEALAWLIERLRPLAR